MYALKNRKAFTIIEIMIAVSILGVLASVTISNVMRSRENAITSQCLANIKQLDSALQMASALEVGVSMENLSEAEIEAIVVPDYLRSMPDCQYGAYSTNSDGQVECDFESH